MPFYVMVLDVNFSVDEFDETNVLCFGVEAVSLEMAKSKLYPYIISQTDTCDANPFHEPVDYSKLSFIDSVNKILSADEDSNYAYIQTSDDGDVHLAITSPDDAFYSKSFHLTKDISEVSNIEWNALVRYGNLLNVTELVKHEAYSV